MDPDGNGDVESFLRKQINLYNLQLAVDNIVMAMGQTRRKFVVSEETIRGLHRVAMDALLPEAGSYRNIAVHINNSPHVPPNWIEVPAHMGAFCRYLNENWGARDLVHLSAFTMWRLNWIHPFRNGNGRIARAASYLILCAKHGKLLPAKNSVLQQIVENKEPYYQAHRFADNIYSATGSIDEALKALESLLAELLKKQIQANVL